MEKYIYKEVDGELVAFDNPDWRKHIQTLKFNHYLKESNIPSDYYDYYWEHIDFGANQRVVGICKGFVSGFKESKLNLYLYGINTTGKTTAMCSLGKDAIREGYKVKFILASDLLDILQKTSGYNYNQDYEYKKNQLFDADLLLIDEVFDSSKSTLWKNDSKNLIVSLLDAFFRHSISNNIKIVTTSNILKERIGSDYSASLFELVDRNFQVLTFSESVKELRKQSLVG